MKISLNMQSFSINFETNIKIYKILFIYIYVENEQLVDILLDFNNICKSIQLKLEWQLKQMLIWLMMICSSHRVVV